MRRSHAYKGYASTYSVQSFNSFNPEVQFKDTESGIRSKLIDLLTGLKDFKFVTTLILAFKKVERDDKTIYNTLYSNSKAKKSY